MPSSHLDIRAIPATLRQGLRDLQDELELPEQFTDEVQREAAQAAQMQPQQHADLTDIEFVTIDPPDAMDLDQAVQLERDGSGYLVRYAISDVAYFVRPGTELERETHRRGQTLYAPGARVPLHPAELSEAAASLLADGAARPALVWQHRLDSLGQLRETRLTRALVRSRAKLSYAGVQADVAADRLHPSIALLPEVGRLRLELETSRGGVSLSLPGQEIIEQDGTWRLEYRELSPIEDYNAQISLLTGFAAAQVMLDHRVGIVRTLPPAEDWALAKLRRAARALQVSWPQDVPYSQFVRGLRPDVPAELAMLTKCTMLFRGASYVAFDGVLPEENLSHAALAAPYAHTTAPLRRLVDRYVLECCHSLLNDQPVPQWVRDGLPQLPEEMAASGRKASAYERGILDLAEALVLHDRVGEVVAGVVTDVHPKSGVGTILLTEPAVELRLPVPPEAVGTKLSIRIDEVDLRSGQVNCSLA